MRKVLRLSVAAILCLAFFASAGEEKKTGGKEVQGTVSKLDTTGKMMMVKDGAGKETPVYWNDSTRVEGGELKQGAAVHVKAMEQDGKMWATWVHVGEMKKM